MEKTGEITDKINTFVATHEYKDIDLFNTSFHYLLCGKGAETLVFLDGGMGTSEAWFEYITHFEKDYRVLTFSFPTNLSTNIEQVQAIKELMNALTIEKATFIGVSYGTLLAQLFTKKFPDFVENLVLISGGGLTSTTKESLKKLKLMFKLSVYSAKILPFKFVKKNILKDSVKNLTNENESKEKKAQIAKTVYQLYKDCSEATIMNMGYLLLDVFDTENCEKADFAFMAKRVLLILPKKDFFPPAAQKSLIDLMNQPEIVWIEDGAHGDPMFDNTYRQIVKNFLDKKRTV